MDIGVKIFLVSAAIVAAIYLFKFIVYKLANKGINAVQKAVADKKTVQHTDHIGEEEKLSEIYNNKGKKE